MIDYGMGNLRSVAKAVEHVAQDHLVKFDHHKPAVFSDHTEMMVNSYHDNGITDLSAELTAFATAADGSVEALTKDEQNILAVMWHPEREEPLSEFDLSLTRRFLEL